MQLGNLRPKEGSKKNKKRVGRGSSAGGGKTCGRGHKGQKSRSGGMKGTGFEGGQTPIYRRIPKSGQFKNILFRKTYSVLNLSDLERFKEKASLQDLITKGLVKKGRLVKILGDGELKHPITVEAHAFSKKAAEKISASGGKAHVIEQMRKE